MGSCGLFLGLSSGPQATEGDAVSDSLPERPDLGQLRRRAKELRDAARQGDAEALERLARHHSTAAAARSGSPPPSWSSPGNWASLAGPFKSRPSTPTLPPARLVRDFVAASVEGRSAGRGACCAPIRFAGRSLLAAAVLGDAEAVREHLAGDPATAVASTTNAAGRRCCTPATPAGIRSIPAARPGWRRSSRLLLDGRGQPRTPTTAGRPRFRSALKGSVEVNNPE